MATFTAFYDANVLYPVELRNLFMHLALTGLFRAKWSADVHEEWISVLLEKRPDLTREKLERTRTLMDLHATDAVVTGYEDLIPGLQLPDPNDRHVLAAAIRGQADVIVTMNLRDFPADIVGAFGIEAQHPDEFILHLIDLVPRAVVMAAETHRLSLKNPLKTTAEYLSALDRQGLTQTACLLRELGVEYLQHVPQALLAILPNVTCDGYYSDHTSSGAGGERQTTLSEYGF